MTPETKITVKRKVLAGDGAGGYTLSRTDSLYEDLNATFRLKRNRNGLQRREQPATVQVQEERVCILYGKPFPAVQQNDTIFDQETQQEWIALHDGRIYPNSLQIDVRRMS